MDVAPGAAGIAATAATLCSACARARGGRFDRSSSTARRLLGDVKREGDQRFCAEQLDDSFVATAAQMLGSIPVPASDEERSLSETDSLARALVQVLAKVRSAHIRRLLRQPVDIALVFDRARQWAALGGAAQRAVRVVWGAEAASALGDVPRECALRSMSPLH